MPGHERAVRGAARPQRPAALRERQLVDRRTRRGGAGAVPALADEVADPGQFRAQVVVHVDEMAGDRPAVGGVPGIGGRLRAGGPGGLVPEPDGAEPLAGVRGRRHAQPFVPGAHRTSGTLHLVIAPPAPRTWLRGQLYART